MQLKAKHGRRFYKDDNAWLKAVYRNNKALIDSTIEGASDKSKYRAFKRRIKEYSLSPAVKAKYGTKKGVSLEAGVKALSMTEDYTSATERFQMNAYAGVKKMKGLDQLKELSGDKKIQRSKIKYDPGTHLYYYEGNKHKGVIYWDFETSPERINFYTQEDLNNAI